MKASVVVRTYNEEQYLDKLLAGIHAQDTRDIETEIVLVDSGSTDNTLKIAEKHGCRIVHIRKEEFSFGRSLNLGCQKATGDFLVFVSGHCVPVDTNWLWELVKPLVDEVAVYSYGRQVGNEYSQFSERQLFRKYFPERSQIPQKGFFCNNANAALTKNVWIENPFDEELTGLEDMELAKRLVEQGRKVAYAAESSVYHLHHEKWSQVRNRYEREAIALQAIMPEVQLSVFDAFRYFVSGVLRDSGSALEEKELIKWFSRIVMFRMMQYVGSYRGNHEHRKLSSKRKHLYFYPDRERALEIDVLGTVNEQEPQRGKTDEYGSLATHEGS